MTFIEKLTEYIISSYEEQLKDICIVLPNRRAGLYLKKHIPLKLKKITFAPSVFSIEDFVCHITGINIADSLSLITELFHVYQNIEKEKAQSFDEFLYWAQVLISDYNDCDINLADTVQVFKLLNETKAISQWNLEQQPLTEHEKDYLDFYNSLSKYYPEFILQLLNKNIAYQGLIYKKAAEKIETYISETKFQKIIFAGFNALTASEEKIIKTLTQSGIAEILWDYDKYYSENKNHEAGHFSRKYKEEWNLSEMKWNEDHFSEYPKNIHITGVPLSIGQAEYAGQIVSEMSDSEINSEKTAIVLADENLLTAVLYCIPEKVKHLNITMGYPLANTAAYALFESIFKLFINAEKYKSSENYRYYYKDISDFLNHPYSRSLLNTKENPHIADHLIETFYSANRSFFSQENIRKLLVNTNLDFIFEIENNLISHLNEILLKFINAFRKSLEDNKTQNSDMEMEYLFHFAVIINKLKNITNESGYINELKTLHSLFSEISSTTNIPFVGEPLKGLQIMGMLETRTLDFENIILLSVNENILPAGKHTNTFIPFDIRNAIGLSNYKQKESIFAYHFYRLIQRAKNIHILYNTQSDHFGSGEKSRFITQLLEELPKYNDKCKITEQVLINNISLSAQQQPILIQKTSEIIATLQSYIENGISPSALNSYISCPLKFYFNYAEKISETDDVAETIDAATLGTVIHHVLKNLFQDFINKNITVDDIKKMHANSAKACEEAFRICYPEGDIKSGKNLLISKVALKIITNFLNTESSFIDTLNNAKQNLFIKQLEEKFKANVPEINISGKIIKAVLSGNIDRIDQAGNTTRIIDYKTGNINNNELKVKEWDDLLSNSKLSKSLQLLCYAYVYMNSINTDKISLGIISFRNIDKGFLPVSIPDAADGLFNREAMTEFENILTAIISNILNTETPFMQTEDLKTCVNCVYSGICNR
ncbi:MAG TPA: PD-(D/E)XK nuclease family protein [Bacteroidales bacterium]|nr:PD-(D/E)XK nuclease family protein [Bacteroidales bacterium]HPS17570.1 PD-(D/E)XK nuclease family protein [Bacteroidales bacterium]